MSHLPSTHNINVSETSADCIVVVRAGKTEEQGDCQAVLSRPQTAYTRELLAAVPRLVLQSAR